MTTNKWQKFASDFEQKNNYVVGINDIQVVKDSISSFFELGNLLELGCGNGTYTQCLIQHATQITATDLSDDMVTVTAKRFSDIEKIKVEQADCFNLSYANNSYDTVFMANLLHVVPNQEQLLAECRRVLKPGGRLLVVSFTTHNMTLLNKLGLKYRYYKTYGSKSANNITLTPELANRLSQSSNFSNSQSKLIGNRVKAVLLEAEKPTQGSHHLV